jgi:hypothetical protein
VPTFGVVTAAASISPKGEALNEDRIGCFDAGRGGAGVVLCDGLGSMPESAAVAEEVSERISDHLSGEGVEKGVWTLERTLEKASFERRDGATTLIVLGATGSGLVGHALVGNGGLVEISPVDAWPSGTRLLWTDIALPQIAWSGDRPGLRSVLPPANGSIEAAKGFRFAPAGHAKMYLVCSDGISSEEERDQGPAPNGSSWKETPDLLAALLARIGKEWVSLLQLSPAEAQQALQLLLLEVLVAAESASGLDDDATVGAVFLRPRAPLENGPSDSGPAR